MATTLTDYAQYSSASIYVSNSTELNAAVTQLAAAGGGTVKVDPNGGPYDLSVNGVGSPSSPVLIESSGSAPPLFHSLTMTNSQYIAVSGVDVDTSGMAGRAKHEDDLRIDNSSNIEVVNSTFTGNAQGYLSEGTSTQPATGEAGATGAFVLNSDNVLIGGNTFTNHFYGVRVKDTTNLEFTQNEVTQFQADGFNGNGLQNAQITDNHLHDPLGSTQTLVHSDFIQIHVSNTSLQNDTIEIAGNLIDSGAGGGAQGIHIGAGGSGARMQNISIHDNVIHTCLPRGIGVSNIDGLEIYNNTLLWNEASSIQASAGSTPNSWDPRIIVDGSTSTQVYDNVASWIRVNGVQDDNGGYQIQYSNPSAANHVSNHILNLDGSGDPNSYDLNILPSSPLYGTSGSAMSWGGTITYATPSTGGVVSQPDASGDTVSPEGTDGTGQTGSETDTDTSGGTSGGESSGSGEPETEGSEGSGPSEVDEEAPEPAAEENAAEVDPSADDVVPVVNEDVEAPSGGGSVDAGSESTLDGGGTSTGTATEENELLAGDDNITGGGGRDVLHGGSGNDRLSGQKGNDKLYGEADDDFLFGGGAKDQLFGGGGNDNLYGGGGNDILDGGAGADFLNGGGGNDVLTGGAGDDLFVFRGNFRNDLITDFDARSDFEKIDLRAIDGIDEWGDISGRITQDGDDVVIAFGKNKVIHLESVYAQDLDANDFLF